MSGCAFTQRAQQEQGRAHMAVALFLSKNVSIIFILQAISCSLLAPCQINKSLFP